MIVHSIHRIQLKIKMRNFFYRLIQNYRLGILLSEDARNRTVYTVCYLLVGDREGEKITIYLNFLINSEISVGGTNKKQL